MALAFQDPGLLWLAAAAGAVPLVAHLVARTRPPEAILPTVEFLQRAMRGVWRLRRPQDWLMLLLRILALVILALGFARPLQLAGEGWGGGTDEKHLVLVVDRSASMAGQAGAQSRFSVATARALEALRGAGRLASVNLVWIDAVPDALHPDMGRTTEPLERALREAAVSGEAGSGAAALALAAERLATVSGTRELVVISDFQTGSWSEALPPLPEATRLVWIPVGETADNLSLAALESSSTQPLPGESIEVLARIVNHGNERRRARISMTLGAQRQTRELEIEGNGEGQVSAEFALDPDESGELPLRAALEGEGDALAGDDGRWIVVRQREPLAVALSLPEGSVSEEEREVWSRLLRSILWTREVAPGDPADLAIVAGPTDSFLPLAEAVWKKKGGVIFRPTAAAGLPTDWESGGAAGSWQKSGADEAGWSLKTGDEKDPLLALFASGEYGNPVAGSARDRWRIDPAEAGPGWAVPVRYVDDVPAIRRRAINGGSLWWWNLPLDPELASWTRQPAFLPLVGEALLLSRPDRADPPHWLAYAGGFARWEPEDYLESGEVVLLDEAGTNLAITEDGTSLGRSWISAAPLEPGLFRWALRDRELQQDRVLAHTVVPFPESEMDPGAIDPASLVAAAADGQSSSALAKPDWEKMRDGTPLWPWFVAIALALFALEALFLMLRRSSPQPARPIAS
ncbi:MAG: VWA domain-containing protein [Verrucomicrobiae bacterium]|nr:VWA domain-containing protein [Verrucomicrobiae bacterium]